MGAEVIVLRERSGADKLTLEDVHEIEQVHRTVVAYVVELVGRDRKPILPYPAFGSVPHHPHDPLNDIINVGKIPLALAVVEYFYFFSSDEPVGKTEIGHIRAAGRTIDREEPQTGGRDVVQLAVGIGEQFVTFLGGGIQAHRIVHLVVSRIRDFLVAAINGRGAGINQMLHSVVAAGFEYVVEADDVALDVGIRGGDGAADSCLRGKVDNHRRLISREHILNRGLVGNAGLDEVPFASEDFYFAKPPIFEIDIIIVSERVDPHHSDVLVHLEQPADKVAADESGSACHKDRASLEIHIIRQHIDELMNCRFDFIPPPSPHRTGGVTEDATIP